MDHFSPTSTSNGEVNLESYQRPIEITFEQDIRYCVAVRELKNSLSTELLTNRNKEETSRATLQSMMDEGALDFNAFRRAIRFTSTQGSDSPALSLSSNKCSQDDFAAIQDQRRSDIIHKIENVIKNVLQDVAHGKYPKLTLRNQKIWSNCVFSDKITLKCTGDSQMTIIKFSSTGSRKKFSLILHLLSTIHQMLLKKSSCTRRELYYQNVDKVKNQILIDSAIRDVCCLLQVPPWEMGVLATSKGLIAGPLTLKSSSGNIVNCMGSGGVLIPQDVLSFDDVKSEAMFILVIEKDTIFQKLLQEGAMERLGPCIFMTGKGYPDINTRLMLKLLVDTLKIPSFALVDADPHGIEIMCTYRFGSLAMSHLSEKLAVPSMRWLGIHPTDINSLNPPSLPLSSRDGGKIRDILSRPYCETVPDLRLQLEALMDNEVKCEIEGVATMSQAYLTDRYIPHKLCAKDLI